MKSKLLFLLLMVLNTIASAQGPKVPSEIEFADMKLRLHEHVRKEIQKEVDALHRSEKYFNIKLDRVNLYFPIIERIFREENVPDDFKYLVIQESALISDAISTSNAVGFWQFKIPSAKEVGLRIDGNIDERLNITASTHGAGRYLKRVNFYFNNWIYALLAYNTGVGGASSLVNDKYFGAKKMELNRRTHWYVIKFLAHKIAFENYINNGNTKRLYEYTDGGGQSLKQVALSFGVDYEELKKYNKWLKRGKVPEDKLYAVIIPGLTAAPVQAIKVSAPIKTEAIEFVSPNSAMYPKIKMGKSDSRIVKVNGITGVIANDGEDLKTLALIGGLELSKFLRINEIDISDNVVSGNVYYFKSKKSKAKEHYHIVLPGENLWSISQKYGVRKQKLIAKNRLKNEDDINHGLVLWLRYIRAADQPVEYVELPSIEEQPTSTNVTQHIEPEIEEMIIDDEVIKSDEFEEDEYAQIIDKYEEEPEKLTDANNTVGVDELPEEPAIELSDDELAELDRRQAPLFHLVEAGETLYAISRKYKIPLDDVLKINDLSPDDKISIGQKIYLKDPFGESNNSKPRNGNTLDDSYINYTVAKGDTMYSISKKYNVSVEDILKWNNKKDNNLKIGEIVRIKDIK
jgi:membrane-bound lytic murein transglycosylase D